MFSELRTLVEVAERTPSTWTRPFGQIGLDEWFDRWPELFARRWPESFRGFPMMDEAFRGELPTAEKISVESDG